MNGHFATMTPPENSSSDLLRDRQERAEMMALLREQETLARMEELRSRQELEEFVADLEHEKQLKSVLRQQELDKLWEHVAERSREESLRRRVEELRLMRDAQTVRNEIEALKRELEVRRAKKKELHKEIVQARHDEAQVAAEHSIEDSLADSISEREDALEKTGFQSAEWALMSRMEERLEGVLESMERLASDSDSRGGVETGIPFDLDMASPSCPFEPKAIIVASKGVARLDEYPPTKGVASIPRPLLGYNSSTRSLSIAKHPDGLVPILLAGNRHGVAHLDPQNATIIANYRLDKARRYAVNAAGFLQDGRLLATHSQLGLLEWDAPDKPMLEVGGNQVESARLLRIQAGGRKAYFTSHDSLMKFDLATNAIETVKTFQGRVATSLEIAGSLAVIGDTAGAVHFVDLKNPSRQLSHLLVGEKVYTLGLLNWKGATWVAAGVKRRTGVYLILKELRDEMPELMLNVPERIHTIRCAGPGVLVAASERFISFWDLNKSHRSLVTPMGNVAPVQDIAFAPS